MVNRGKKMKEKALALQYQEEGFQRGQEEGFQRGYLRATIDQRRRGGDGTTSLVLIQVKSS